MESWRLLPDVPLEAAGPHSAALRREGCRTFRDAGRHLRRLPYGRNTDRACYGLVLAEGCGTCSTKHALLAAVAREQEIEIALTVGIYDMTEANTPGVGEILRAHGLSSIPEAHCYLVHAGRRIDVTRGDVRPSEPIARFDPEWTIEPSGIGEEKLALHRRHLRRWLQRHRELPLSFEELWAVREACIRRLSDGPSRAAAPGGASGAGVS